MVDVMEEAVEMDGCERSGEEGEVKDWIVEMDLSCMDLASTARAVRHVGSSKRRCGRSELCR